MNTAAAVSAAVVSADVRYPLGLIQPLTLADGRRLVVRPVLPQDDAAEQAFVMALSAASRYRRFHVGLRALPPSTLAQLTHVDHQSHVALVAQLEGDDDEPVIVADARYVKLGDDRAEFAIAVADAWQGQGLGRRLLCMLARYAARRGIHTLHGDVLADNAPMIAMLRRLGGELVVRADEPGLLVATVVL